MKNNVLYLASASPVRQSLLHEARIPFTVISHGSNELLEQGALSFEEYVLAIARDKMKHVQLPASIEENTIFVAVADTLIQSKMSKQICGKPASRSDAERMLLLWQKERAVVTTACIVHKREIDESGKEKSRHTQEVVVSSEVEFVVPGELFNDYFTTQSGALQSAGAGVVEGYGLQFVKRIEGSYSAVIGLPLFELRTMLKSLDF